MVLVNQTHDTGFTSAMFLPAKLDSFEILLPNSVLLVAWQVFILDPGSASFTTICLHLGPIYWSTDIHNAPLDPA